MERPRSASVAGRSKSPGIHLTRVYQHSPFERLAPEQDSRPGIPAEPPGLPGRAARVTARLAASRAASRPGAKAPRLERPDGQRCPNLSPLPHSDLGCIGYMSLGPQVNPPGWSQKNYSLAAPVSEKNAFLNHRW